MFSFSWLFIIITSYQIALLIKILGTSFHVEIFFNVLNFLILRNLLNLRFQILNLLIMLNLCSFHVEIFFYLSHFLILRNLINLRFQILNLLIRLNLARELGLNILLVLLLRLILLVLKTLCLFFILSLLEHLLNRSLFHF